MKKYLASILALSIVTPAITSVVSCGPISFTKLLSRTVNTETYHGSYKIPMTSWSSATSMQLSDSIILTNLEDSLLATDQYNNFEGDLADNWRSVADNNDPRWDFHVRRGMKWTSVKNGHQTAEYDIKPSDFFNTFRFTYNSNNASQTSGVWSQVINHGEDLSSFLRALSTSESDLYDARFDNNETESTEVNYYIDRAILAYNLNPKDEITAKKIALSKVISTDILAKQSFKFGKIISGVDPDPFDKHDDQDFNLTYHLLKGAPYFESIGAFLSFAPLPDLSIDYLKPMTAGINYGTPQKDGKFGYDTIWYSGAYVVSDYNPTQNLNLVQNDFYFNKDNVHVKKQNYSYVGNVDESRQRFYFETGDLSEVVISSSDRAGWQRYIGDDIENPKFNGLNLVNRPQSSTFSLFFNYGAHEATQDNKQAISSELNQRNKTLAQRSVRNLIRYAMNRSEIATYYSKAMDTKKPGLSHNLRNTYTSKNVSSWTMEDGIHKKDFTTYLQEQYFQENSDGTNFGISDKSEIGGIIALLANKEYGLAEEQIDNWKNAYASAQNDQGEAIHPLSDGVDPYMNNDILGALSFVNGAILEGNHSINPDQADRLKQYVALIGDYSDEANAKKMALLKEQAIADMKENGVDAGVALPWLINGANSTGINTYIKVAINDLNASIGDVINIQPRESTDASDFMVQQNAGAYSLIISGWVPDYADPYGFHHTLFTNGDLDIMTGLSKVLDTPVEDNQVDTHVNKEFEDLSQRVNSFMTRSSETDRQQITDVNKRYQSFAEAENNAIIDSVLTLPLQIQLQDNVPYLSYVNPFTRSTFASGQAIYRFVGVEMIDRLWDKNTFKTKQKAYEYGANSYQSIYPGKDGKIFTVINSDWIASDNKN